ncbi:MAG: ABC transporter ATP-binding protein [Candidatus Hodarchaeales archaeon]
MTTQTENSVIVKGLIKSYGSLIAIDRINLTVNKSECLGIVGPNGAGKTTFFQCLMGLVKIQNGSIHLFGKKTVKEGKILSILSKIRSKIGYVPDFLKIYPFLTSEEYIHFLGKLFGLTQEKLLIRTKYLMKTFELEPDSNVLVKKLSRGNRQKLLLSTAFIHQPQILLLDEPFTGLDASVRRKAKNLITEFVTIGIPELGINNPGTVIISSHILSDIQDLCTRVGIINSGSLVWEGTINDVKKGIKGNNGLETLVLELWGRD